MKEYDATVWGKKDPYCSLSGHMIAVGCCAERFLSAVSSDGITEMICKYLNAEKSDIIRLISYISAMHDIGKADSSFQLGKSGYRHEQEAVVMLKALWKDYLPTKCIGLFSAAIRIHHQGKGESSVYCKTKDEYWLSVRTDIEKRIRFLFISEVPEITIRDCDSLGVILSFVIVVADWVASSEDFAAEKFECIQDDLACKEAMLLQADIVLKRFGLIGDKACTYPICEDFCDLWKDIAPENMRPLQKTCNELPDMRAPLTILEAPMGEGKTEAALFLASLLCKKYGKKGIYMALPTAATSNQMVDRVRKLLKKHDLGEVRLLHATAWLMDETSDSEFRMEEDDTDSVSDWMRPLRRGMLAENAVGTVDQAMAAVLKLKYGLLRLGGLAGKVLIIDEIHAYDLYMSTIIARLLEWCRALNIPVILLSATLQNEQKARYIGCFTDKQFAAVEGYPLITRVSEAGEVYQYPVAGAYMRRRFEFRSLRIDDDATEIARIACERVKNGGCLCVMLNTVRMAQNVYRELKKIYDGDSLLFHARFLAGRRAEIEKKCIHLFGKGGERPQRMILVCTQVVEQSLDVDFDAMITQIAPLDLLLQRAGRVHRHTNPRPDDMKEPVITVLLPSKNSTTDVLRRYGACGAVYEPLILKKTEELLKNGRIICVPEDVRECVEEAYRDVGAGEIEACVERMVKQTLQKRDANACIFMPPNKARFFAETSSHANSLCISDTDDVEFGSGGKTRDGKPGINMLFLSKDFLDSDGNINRKIEAMLYGCKITVSERDMNSLNKVGASIIRNCEIAWLEDDGLYTCQNRRFRVDDEYGVEEVANKE